MAVHKLWCVLLCCVALGAAVRPITPKLPIPENEQLNWAQYSPYFPAAEYTKPPSGCNVDQVCDPCIIRHESLLLTQLSQVNIVSTHQLVHTNL